MIQRSYRSYELQILHKLGLNHIAVCRGLPQGAICLVNSVNERDLSLLTSYAEPSLRS